MVLAALSPLGLASGEVADQAAQALGMRHARPTATPLADVMVRWFSLLPAGEVGTRAHIFAAAAGTTALALLLARVRLLPRARTTASSLIGLTLLALCRPFLEISAIHPAAAADFCLLAAITLALEWIRRAPGRSSIGLGLAFLCGLAAGGGWPVRAATWPLALILTASALRRGERWPLMAPTLFVAGAAVTLAGAVSAQPDAPGTARMLLHQIVWPVSSWWTHALPGPADQRDWRQILAWIIDDAGVLGLLMGAIGCVVLLLQARRQTLVAFVAWGTAVTASLLVGEVLAARLFVVGALMSPVIATADFFSRSFGRARAAVVLVLLVIVVVPPAMVGVGSAMQLPGRQNPAAVARGLDLAFDRGSAQVMPPSGEEAQRWWDYATALWGPR